MAGRRRGVVGSRSAPRAGRPRQLAAYHRDRGKKRAGLSRDRKRLGSWRRPASGNPLFRIEPLARIARRAGDSLRAAAGTPVAGRSTNLGRGVQEDFPQAELHLARVRPSPAHRPLCVAEPHNRQDGASRDLCRWIRETGEVSQAGSPAVWLRAPSDDAETPPPLVRGAGGVVARASPRRWPDCARQSDNGAQRRTSARAGPAHAPQVRGMDRPDAEGRRIFAGSLRAAARDDSIAQGPDQADARPRRRGARCAGRPGRTHVLSRWRFGAPERWPRSQRAAGRRFRRPRLPAWGRR